MDEQNVNPQVPMPEGEEAKTEGQEQQAAPEATPETPAEGGEATQ